MKELDSSASTTSKSAGRGLKTKSDDDTVIVDKTNSPTPRKRAPATAKV
jgi:hypothetical protein